jgi:putative monooxygenase
MPERICQRPIHEGMDIFWTYASVDATRTIVATGVTTRIDEEHGTAVAQ